MRNASLKLLLVAAASLCASHAALAQVKITDAWARATVPQQSATGAFMRITAEKDARLVEVRSPVAKVAEIHEMSMVDNVMRMRPVSALALPAGKAVELRPNGYHVMLMGLKEQIKEGDAIQLSLTIEDKDNKREVIELKVPVRPLAASGPAAHHKH